MAKKKMSGAKPGPMSMESYAGHVASAMGSGQPPPLSRRRAAVRKAAERTHQPRRRG